MHAVKHSISFSWDHDMSAQCRLSEDMLLLLSAELIVFFFDDLHVRPLGVND